MLFRSKKTKLKNAQVFSRPISPWIIGLIKIIYNAINKDPKNMAPKNLVIAAHDAGDHAKSEELLGKAMMLFKS